MDELGGHRIPVMPSSARMGEHFDERVYMATPEYPEELCKSERWSTRLQRGLEHNTFFVLWEAKVDVPARHKNHVILEIFALDLCLLHDDNVCLERIEHSLTFVSTLVCDEGKRIPDNAIPGTCGSPAMADS